MHIETAFRLGVPVDSAWPVLIDLERVAPCMPGVTVESSHDDYLHATMRVKVGPVTATYRATVAVESLDEVTHTAVLRVRGQETRGPGTVDADVTAALSPDGDGGASSTVALTTELEVTGKVAQFGGGVMTQVADRLLQQFAQRLEAELAAPVPEEAPAAAALAAQEPETVHLGPAIRGALASRLRLAGLGALLLVALRFLRRR
jgi:carbon monoxide dehydrogenase subunit G